MKSIYDVVVKPIITEKSNVALEKNVYTFLVNKDATKIDVRNAIEKLYNVKVSKVNTMVMEGKTRRIGRHEGKASDWKKAIVYLAKDNKIEAFLG